MQRYFRDEPFTTDFDKALNEQFVELGGQPPERIACSLIDGLDIEQMVQQRMIDHTTRSLICEMESHAENVEEIPFSGFDGFYDRVTQAVFRTIRLKPGDQFFTGVRSEWFLGKAAYAAMPLGDQPRPETLFGVPLKRFANLGDVLIYAPQGWFNFTPHSHFRRMPINYYEGERSFAGEASPFFKVKAGMLKRWDITGLDSL